MACAICGGYQRDDDYLCDKHREIEDMVLSQRFPESEKLKAGREEHYHTFLKFLGFLHRDNLAITHILKESRTQPEEVYPLNIDDEGLFRNFLGVDRDKLRLEQEAMVEVLRRMNAPKVS